MSTMATPGSKDDGELVPLSCASILDTAFECVTATHQTRTYYRTGEADTCDGRWTDIWRCFRANQMDDDKAKEYLKGTHLDPAKKQHVASVWNLKETPGW